MSHRPPTTAMAGYDLRTESCTNINQHFCSSFCCSLGRKVIGWRHGKSVSISSISQWVRGIALQCGNPRKHPHILLPSEKKNTRKIRRQLEIRQPVLILVAFVCCRQPTRNYRTVGPAYAGQQIGAGRQWTMVDPEGCMRNENLTKILRTKSLKDVVLQKTAL